jgi:hypothetical protein
MNRLIKTIAVFLFLSGNAALAQDSQPAASNITLAVIVPQTITGLSSESVTLLGNKLAVIVTNNGLATTDQGAKFVITPTASVTSIAQTSGGMRKFWVANVSLSIFIKQGANGVVFSNYSRTIQGTGDTKEEAVASAITGISVDDAAYGRFIDQAKQKIGAWYAQNCNQYMMKAQAEIAQKHYDAAKAILDEIPLEAGQCYTDAQKKIGDIYAIQYGSLENAAVALQQKVTINPDDAATKQKLDDVKKVIDARNDADKTPPVIALITPKVTRGQGVEADVKANLIYVSGTASDPSGIASVSINGQNLEGIRPDGFFQAKINGDVSDIAIQATDKKNNVASQTFHIASKTEEKITPADIQPLSDNERFHAIFIANSNYGGGKWPALNTTVGEARNIRKLLIDKYGFNSENVDTLFNKERKDVLEAVKAKMDKLTDNDNLILFYGGHGYFVESTNMAYWVPLNAETEFDYISNTDITNLMKSCQARHILIMADACFSGAMRGGLDAPSKYEYKFKSRQLLTSGGSEPVPGKSAYVQMILETLNTNQDKYVSARELYTRIAKGIMDQTRTEPTLRDMNVEGSQGGQFYFRRN